jgi:hypothetical protein
MNSPEKQPRLSKSAAVASSDILLMVRATRQASF